MPVVNYHSVNGQMVGQSTGTTFTQYLTDALGSVTATVNGKRVTNTYRYKPYGERLAKTGTGADPDFQWIGDTGSRVTGRSRAEQYNRARHYGTRQSSWTSVDQSWPVESQYHYVFLNPSNLIDPEGFRGSNSNNRNSLNRGGRSVWYPAPGGRGRIWRPDPAYPRIDPNDSPYAPRPAPRPTPRRTPGRGTYPGNSDSGWPSLGNPGWPSFGGNGSPSRRPWRPPGYDLCTPFGDPEALIGVEDFTLPNYRECDYWSDLYRRECGKPQEEDCCFERIGGPLPDNSRGRCIQLRLFVLRCDRNPPPGWVPNYKVHVDQLCDRLNSLANCQADNGCLQKSDPFWAIFRSSCAHKKGKWF